MNTVKSQARAKAPAADGAATNEFLGSHPVRNVRRERGGKGWHVQVTRRGTSYVKYFSDLEHGGTQRALHAAIAYRNELSQTPDAEPEPPKEFDRVRNVRREKNGTAWLVQVMRNGVSHKKYFADREYGGCEPALLVAIEYRDWLMRVVRRQAAGVEELGGEGDLNFSQPGKLKKSNTSGVLGVHLSRTPNKDGMPRLHWVAEWVPVPNGRPERRRFSVARYGDAEAKALAIEARDEAMRLLEEQRHGQKHGEAPGASSRKGDKVIVEVHLGRQAAQRLAALVRKRGMSRSALIAEFVDAGLAV
ncbi:MAG: AP2 domain-containing protein [Burkholderiales bacterium]|nr:AP2 domain-containing protein [Burkholderiales bacterium]